MTIAFLLYTGLIPAVPLFGAALFRRRGDHRKKIICYGLFALQVLLSIAYIIAWFRTR